jgi:hypothetical protein
MDVDCLALRDLAELEPAENVTDITLCCHCQEEWMDESFEELIQIVKRTAKLAPIDATGSSH